MVGPLWWRGVVRVPHWFLFWGAEHVLGVFSGAPNVILGRGAGVGMIGASLKSFAGFSWNAHRFWEGIPVRRDGAAAWSTPWATFRQLTPEAQKSWLISRGSVLFFAGIPATRGKAHFLCTVTWLLLGNIFPIFAYCG